MSTKANLRPERILSFEDAHQLVRQQAELVRRHAREIQQVPILDSLGRTLAEEIVADRDFPPFPRATRDGYAVRSKDVEHPPALLSLVGQVRAGGSLPPGFTRLGSGQAISIMTGAPVPNGADAVVMVEYTENRRAAVRVLRPAVAGENIVARGSEAPVGGLLVERGTLISHAHIALAAAAGKPQLRVFAKPKIAILPTGDEVIPIDSIPADNQIRNSNSFSVAAQVIAAGGEPIQLPIAPDEPERLRQLIAQGLSCDLLLMSGGVSAGEYDLVENVLADFSAEFLFTGAHIQPGKPLVFGRARRQQGSAEWAYFFGLPGNPISTMVTFELFARMMVRALSGAAPELSYGTKARLASAVRVKTGLTRFLPARLKGVWNEPEVEPVKWQGSGDVAAFSRADCLLVVPPDREQFESGELMTVLRLRNS